MTNEERSQAIADMRRVKNEYMNGRELDEAAERKCNSFDMAINALEQTTWIPVSERLPDNTDPVNITWVNHDPEVYYADIKDKPFTATGHYCNGRWWWYSASCQDYLDEYGHCDDDAMDDAIEVIAWMPLPEPYKGE